MLEAIVLSSIWEETPERTIMQNGMTIDQFISQLNQAKNQSSQGGNTQVQLQQADGSWVPVNSINIEGTGNQQFVGLSTQGTYAGSGTQYGGGSHQQKP